MEGLRWAGCAGCVCVCRGWGGGDPALPRPAPSADRLCPPPRAVSSRSGRCVPVPGRQRTSVIDLFCNRDVSTAVLKYVAEDPECVYNFAIETKDACLPDGGGGFGNVLKPK